MNQINRNTKIGLIIGCAAAGLIALANYEPPRFQYKGKKLQKAKHSKATIAARKTYKKLTSMYNFSCKSKNREPDIFYGNLDKVINMKFEDSIGCNYYKFIHYRMKNCSESYFTARENFYFYYGSDDLPF